MTKTESELVRELIEASLDAEQTAQGFLLVHMVDKDDDEATDEEFNQAAKAYNASLDRVFRARKALQDLMKGEVV